MKVMSLLVSYFFNTYFLNPILIRLLDKDHLYPIHCITQLFLLTQGYVTAPAFALVLTASNHQTTEMFGTTV